MLLSMTGYGRARKTYEGKDITIEIRSLNSKYADLRFKLPQNYKNLEPEFRRIVTKRAERGKIDVTIDVQSLNGDDEYGLNRALFLKYFQELKAISLEEQLPQGDLMQAILKLPNVVATVNEEIDEQECKVVMEIMEECLDNFIAFRLDEGNMMKEDCSKHVNLIVSQLEELPPFEENRIEKLKKRLKSHMEEYVGQDNIDANRFEQEILYYLEKFDITEEKVRLAQHCKYFLEELNTPNTLKGRKLIFISQEMGREINTLGAKANSSEIQHYVVKMKDELEKIKEQVANSV